MDTLAACAQNGLLARLSRKRGENRWGVNNLEKYAYIDIDISAGRDDVSFHRLGFNEGEPWRRDMVFIEWPASV